MTNLNSILRSSDNYCANKGPSSQSYGFSSSHVCMWELAHKETWKLKNWCFWTVVLEKTLESPLDSKEIQTVNPKRKQCWMFIGGNDVEAEASILWPSDVKNWLMGKDPDAGKDWRQEEKGPTEDAGEGRDMGSITGWGRSPGIGNGNLFQYPCLKNSMGRAEPGALPS